MRFELWLQRALLPILLILLVGAIPCFNQEVEIERISGVGQFYRTAPGTMAFLPNVNNLDDAKNAVEFCLLIGSGTCILPKQNRYFFRVNHFLEEDSGEGEVTYLGVEIIRVFPKQVNVPEPVFLFRNTNWQRESDPNFDRQKIDFASRLPIERFFECQQDASTLEQMDLAFSVKWHGTPEGSKESSWERRYQWIVQNSELNKDFLIPNAPRLLKGYLIRFIAVPRRNRKLSKEPLDFYFERLGCKSVYLHVFCPNMEEFTKTVVINFK